MAYPWTRLEACSGSLPAGLHRLEDEDAVQVLWMCGDVPPPPRVGIVGTRTPDLTGIETARLLAREGVGRGWCVVSGGAAGIDAAAHEGCIHAGGRTIVVSAAGAGVAYPPIHADLFSRVLGQGGAILTEREPGQKPYRGSFLARNRIIAALSDILVVVQARFRSGALNTARWANKIGVPVFAVPGSPQNPLHAGPNALVSSGEATIVLDLGTPFGASPGKVDREVQGLLDLDELHGKVLGLLGTQPASVEELACMTGLEPGPLLRILLHLEFKGLITRDATGACLKRLDHRQGSMY